MLNDKSSPFLLCLQALLPVHCSFLQPAVIFHAPKTNNDILFKTMPSVVSAQYMQAKMTFLQIRSNFGSLQAKTNANGARENKK